MGYKTHIFDGNFYTGFQAWRHSREMTDYLRLGCKFQLYDSKKEEFIRPETKHVIIADSVINTGHTIKKILEPDMIVVCCVINEKAVELFGNQLYTIRVSKNSFVGSNVCKQNSGVAPDTTMRLFNQI